MALLQNPTGCATRQCATSPGKLDNMSHATPRCVMDTVSPSTLSHPSVPTPLSSFWSSASLGWDRTSLSGHVGISSASRWLLPGRLIRPWSGTEANREPVPAINSNHRQRQAHQLLFTKCCRTCSYKSSGTWVSAISITASVQASAARSRSV